jgi:hypothetical protein
MAAPDMNLLVAEAFIAQQKKAAGLLSLPL